MVPFLVVIVHRWHVLRPWLSVRLESHFHRKMVADGKSLEGEGEPQQFSRAAGPLVASLPPKEAVRPGGHSWASDYLHVAENRIVGSGTLRIFGCDCFC